MVEFSCVRRWEKRNRTHFYWGVVKACVRSIQYGIIETFLPPEGNFYPKMFQYPQTKIFLSEGNVSIPPYCILQTSSVKKIPKEKRSRDKNSRDIAKTFDFLFNHSISRGKCTFKKLCCLLSMETVF